MPESELQPEEHRADVSMLGRDVGVVIELSRQHDKRLRQISGRLDVHGRRLQYLERQFDETALRVDRRLDQVDDRFVHVEQRLDFICGQLAALLRRQTG